MGHFKKYSEEIDENDFANCNQLFKPKYFQFFWFGVLVWFGFKAFQPL